MYTPTPPLEHGYARQNTLPLCSDQCWPSVTSAWPPNGTRSPSTATRGQGLLTLWTPVTQMETRGHRPDCFLRMAVPEMKAPQKGHKKKNYGMIPLEQTDTDFLNKTLHIALTIYKLDKTSRSSGIYLRNARLSQQSKCNLPIIFKKTNFYNQFKRQKKHLTKLNTLS